MSSYSFDHGAALRPKGLYDDKVEMAQINPVPLDPDDGARLPGIPVPLHPSTSFSGDALAKISSEEDIQTQQITLHQAARDGRLDIVTRRVKKLGRHVSKGINKKDEDEQTPLHYAIRYGHPEIAGFLLDHGADVNVLGEDGASPIHYAARFRLGKSQRHRENNEEFFNVDKFILQDKLNRKDNADAVSTTPATSDPECDEDEEKIAQGKGQLSLSQIESEVEPETALIEYLVSKSADINIQDLYGSTPLHYATMKGNEMAVEEILKIRGVNINACDKGSMTPLHNACQQGNPIVVKVLIEHGADMLARDDKLLTPLHHACAEGKEDVAKLLFHFGEMNGGKKMVREMLSAVDNEHQTPLHCAVEGGQFFIAKTCLQHGANINDIRNNLETPLHLAATTGNLKICKLLMKWRADVECKNKYQETPLHLAAKFNRVDVVDHLLKVKAEVNCRDREKFTPLLEAAMEGHVDTIECLLNNGADIRARDHEDKTSIYWAAEENHVEALKVLLDDKLTKGKKLIDIPDRRGNTPLHIAAEKGFILAVRVLLNHGAAMSNNEDEHTPLHLAAINGRTKTVVELVRVDTAIVNDEDEASNTALHLAALEGHTGVVKALVSFGAAIDARNAKMWTPLDCAASEGHSRTAQILLEEDAPVDSLDKAKITPLHLASQKGHVEMIKLLLSWNADISLLDIDGMNCLDMAIDNGHKEAAIEILRHENWRLAMRNCTYMENGRVTTPMRKLICKMPEVAEFVLTNCTNISKDTVESPNFHVRFDYEFLEDIYADWITQTGDDDTSSMGRSSLAASTDANLDSLSVQSVTSSREGAYRLRQLEKKKSNPLALMVAFKRDKLLTHPLVVFLLQTKWNRYGVYVYYIKLFIYLFFLTFLTGYVVYFTENRPVPVEVATFNNKTTMVCKDTFDTEGVAYIVWVGVGVYIIIGLAVFHIITEIIQFLNQGRDYFSLDNLLEWAVYVLAIIYVADDFLGEQSKNLTFTSRCDDRHKDIGGISIFLAWMVLVLFVRKLPKFGIYVVMFTDVLRTFSMFFMIFLLFLVAFGLAFYAIFKHHPDIISFNTVGKSMVKTSVMMIGEFDFDNLFNDPNNPASATAWVLFVIFVILMTLILMNLLIGLAVDDIKGVQEQAVLTRQAMQVDLSLVVEKSMPRGMRSRFAVLSEEVYLNNAKGWRKIFSRHPISAIDIKTAMAPEKGLIEEVRDETAKVQEFTLHLKNRLKTLQNRSDSLEAMVRAIVRHLDIEVDEEVVQEGQ